MSVWAWLAWLAAVGLAAWVVIAVVVGLTLGGVVRNRNQQIPSDSPIEEES